MNPLPPSIHIERVDLHLPGFPRGTAEAAVGGLGPALRSALANPPSDNIPITREMSAADLTRLLAQRLAASIRREATTPEEPF